MVTSSERFGSVEFENKHEADKFAKEVRGVVEGPFIDENINSTYIVFYNDNKQA